MLDRIKTLAVRELHAAVHLRNLHGSKQMAGQSVKAFAAQVRGISNCTNLRVVCPAATCSHSVSFAEPTVYPVTLTGLRGPDLQTKCLSAAYMKSVKNIQDLVMICSSAAQSEHAVVFNSRLRQSSSTGRNYTAKPVRPRAGLGQRQPRSGTSLRGTNQPSPRDYPLLHDDHLCLVHISLIAKKTLHHIALPHWGPLEVVCITIFDTESPTSSV